MIRLCAKGSSSQRCPLVGLNFCLCDVTLTVNIPRTTTRTRGHAERRRLSSLATHVTAVPPPSPHYTL
eukprot:scaffold3036_cov75-Skeletonema_marinoi.AAC.1